MARFFSNSPTQSYLKLTDTEDLNFYPCTMVCWVKWDSASSNPFGFSTGFARYGTNTVFEEPGDRLGIQNDEWVTARIRRNAVYGTSTLGEGKPFNGALSDWHHLAYVATSPLDHYFYIDGVFKQSELGFDMDTSPHPIMSLGVGACTFVPGPDDGGAGLNGAVADCAIWTTALTAEEIHAIAYMETPPGDVQPTFLKGWWPLTLGGDLDSVVPYLPFVAVGSVSEVDDPTGPPPEPPPEPPSAWTIIENPHRDYLPFARTSSRITSDWQLRKLHAALPFTEPVYVGDYTDPINNVGIAHIPGRTFGHPDGGVLIGGGGPPHSRDWDVAAVTGPPVTVSVWLKTYTGGPTNVLLMGHNNPSTWDGFYLQPSPTVVTGIEVSNNFAYSSGISTTSVLNAVTYSHIVFVIRNNSYRAIYFNGKKEGESTTAVPQALPWVKFKLWDSGLNTHPFSAGWIRDIRVWNDDLTDQQIYELYTRGYALRGSEVVPPAQFPVRGEIVPASLTADAGAFDVAGQDVTFGRGFHADAGVFALSKEHVALTAQQHDFVSIGSIGTANSKTANQTSLVLTTNATAEAGNVVVVIVAKDNTQTTNNTSTNITLADSAGNTWTKVGEHTYSGGSAQDGTTTATFISQLTNQLTSGGTITATLGGTTTSNDASAMVTWEFSLTDKTLNIPGIVKVSAGFASGTSAMTHTISGLVNKSYLWLHGAGLEQSPGGYGAPTNYTEIPDASSSGSTSATNQTAAGAFRILISTNQSISTSISADKAGVFAAISAQAKLFASAGAFDVAGQPAEKLQTIIWPADAGAFALAGQDAVLVGGEVILPVDAGAFALAGQDAGLVVVRQLTADVGAFALAGQDAALRRVIALISDTGAYALAGQSALTVVLRKIISDSGAFSLAGQPALLVPTRLLTSETGAYALTGVNANLITLGKLSADTGTFALAGQSADLRAALRLVSDQGVYNLAGQSAGLMRAFALLSNAGAFALSGQPALFQIARKLVIDAGAFALAGQAPDLLYGYRMTSLAGAYALAGQAALFKRTLIQPSDAGAYALAGQLANLLVGRTAIAAPGAYTLAGQVALFARTRVLQTDSGIYVLAGTPASLLGNRLVTGNLAIFDLEGEIALLLTGRRLPADELGLYTLDGQDIAIGIERYLVTDYGIFLLDGEDAGLVHRVPVLGAGRIFYVARDERIVYVGKDGRIVYIPSDPNRTEGT